jgi:hypothetical protein
MDESIVGILEGMAREAGYEPEEHKDSIVVTVQLEGGRKHVVHISEAGRGGKGMRIVSFVSAVQRLNKGLLGKSMKHATAIDLLHRNARMPFAAFCLLAGADGQDTLCVRSTQLLETMDPEEFQASCLCVAQFADEYEATLGKDEF